MDVPESVDPQPAGDVQPKVEPAPTSAIDLADVAYAGERLRKLHDARTATYARMQVVELVGRIGDASSRDWLTALRDDAAQDARVRDAAKTALAALDEAHR